MSLDLLKEKTNLLVPIFLVLLIFFIPISSSIKSILIIPTLLLLLFAPYYRPYLSYALNTLWARAALILFIYILISCFWSEAPLSMRYNVIDKYYKLIFLPILAVGFIKPQTRFWSLNSYIFVTLLTCFLSILKAKNLLMINTPDPGEVFYNHIVTGFMIALGVYFAGILVFQANINSGLRIVYIFMVLLGSYQIFFINTGRTGYVAYGILMSLLIIQKFPPKKALIGIMTFLGMISLIYALSPVMQTHAHMMINDIKLLQNNQTNTSLGFRIQFHHYAQSLFEKNPVIGVGTGGFQYSFSKDQPVPSWGHKLNDPHGQYWLILAEQGLIGLVLFIAFLGALLVTTFQLKEMKPFLLGLLVSFCMLCFSDTVFCYSTIGYLLIFFSALCFGELIEKRAHATLKELVKNQYELNAGS